MSGRYCVSLRKIDPACPCCDAPRAVATALVGGTVIRTSCNPRRCRIARSLALAGGKAPGYEPMPLDDRDQLRRPLWAKSGSVA